MKLKYKNYQDVIKLNNQIRLINDIEANKLFVERKNRMLVPKNKPPVIKTKLIRKKSVLYTLYFIFSHSAIAS